MSTLPPQDMEVLITGLKQQVNEESAKIVNVKDIVERTQKETSQAEGLLRDKLEVGPTVVPVASHLPTKPAETDILKLILHQSADLNSTLLCAPSLYNIGRYHMSLSTI